MKIERFENIKTVPKNPEQASITEKADALERELKDIDKRGQTTVAEDFKREMRYAERLKDKEARQKEAETIIKKYEDKLKGEEVLL